MSETYTALIIEDRRDDAFLLQRALGSSLKCGFPYVFTCEVIDRLSVAITRVQSANGIDVILLDLNLPGQTIGFEGFDQLRAVSTIPIVIVTGAMEVDDAARALERGAQSVYYKDILARSADAPHHFINGVWSAIHRQRHVEALKQRVAKIEAVSPKDESKPPLSKVTIAGIITAVGAAIAALVELVKSLRSK